MDWRKYYWRWSVAPYAGAWIEIATALSIRFLRRSLLMQERGLKSVDLIPTLPGDVSLLMQERGLKSDVSITTLFMAVVAPYAGAWIEILSSLTSLIAKLMSLLMQERGLK